jgi:hypothetical protein
MTGGALIAVFGIVVLCQVFGGKALDRLGITGDASGNTPAPPGVVPSPSPGQSKNTNPGNTPSAPPAPAPGPAPSAPVSYI